MYILQQKDLLLQSRQLSQEFLSLYSPVQTVNTIQQELLKRQVQLQKPLLSGTYPQVILNHLLNRSKRLSRIHRLLWFRVDSAAVTSLREAVSLLRHSSAILRLRTLSTNFLKIVTVLCSVSATVSRHLSSSALYHTVKLLTWLMNPLRLHSILLHVTSQWW